MTLTSGGVKFGTSSRVSIVQGGNSILISHTKEQRALCNALELLQ